MKFPSTPTLYRFDGTALVERPGQPAFTRKFVAIGGTARDDVWILDNGGGLYHYDGAGYATMTVPGT